MASADASSHLSTTPSPAESVSVGSSTASPEYDASQPRSKLAGGIDPDDNGVPNEDDGNFVVAGATGDCGVGPSSASEDAMEKNAVPVADDQARERQARGPMFFLLLVGLSMAVFLAALDQTIVGVALTAIAEEFDSLGQVSWVGTAYLLTQTADIFGRKPVFLTAIFIFELGSALCGAAANMNMLIAARAIAGVGGAGIFSLVIIIISDLVPIEHRGSYNGVISACFGIASIAGPLVGGVFVDKISWRWVFYINLPFGGVAALMSIFLLRLPPRPGSGDFIRGLLRVDWLGTSLLVAAVVCLLIPLQAGGSLYAWNSPVVIALFSAGVTLLAAFVAVETLVAVAPVIPPALYRDRRVAAACAAAAGLGANFFALVFYAPVWFEVVRNLSATAAGVRVIPLVLGCVVMSLTVGFASSATGYAYIFIPLSTAPLAVGIGLLSSLTEESLLWQEILYTLLIGFGIGCSIQTILLVGQATVPIEMISTVTANINFWQTIGGVIALAICSATFNNELPVLVSAELAAANATLPDDLPVQDLFASPALIWSAAVPDAARLPVVRGFVRAFAVVFRVCVGFACAQLLASLFMKKGRLGLAHAKAGAVTA
ncbi:hypothetical protein HK405_003111 [Cladochytrium tenue]|nr:hypothetical protein HK405_003111 [Cladochytrium tenue]